jgi:hypothetical protein
MNALPPLKPHLDLYALYPKGTIFAPRSTAQKTRWAYTSPMNLDSSTGNAITVMGRMPLICHRGVATPSALDFLVRAGHSLPSDMLTYETEEEAVSLALSRIRKGERLAYICPPPLDLEGSPYLVVPVEKYNFLNNKANMPFLVDPEFLPQRSLIPQDCFNELHIMHPDLPIFLKIAYPGVSGGGVDVRFCPDAQSWSDALEWVEINQDGITGAIVEQAIDVRTCWCFNVGILESRCTYLGAAIQLFSEPAMQSGSRIDPEDAPPPKAVEIALAIAEKARKGGYRGIAGFDIGISQGDKLFVFDLNFRTNGSTPQVLLHEAAVARVGAKVSQSWHVVVNGLLDPLIERISPLAETGRFVPTRLFEYATDGECRSMATGFVVAATVDEADVLCRQLSDAVETS